MKNLKLYMTAVLTTFLSFGSAYAQDNAQERKEQLVIGVEGGFAMADTADAARALGQAFANSTGRTVTYTYEESTFAGRIFGLYTINELVDLEAGYMYTGSMDAKYSFSGTTATSSIGLKANGFDAGIRANIDSGIFLKVGMHKYDLDTTASVTISGTTYTATSTSSDASSYFGAGFDIGEKASIGYTLYNKVGGEDGGDVGFLYLGYKF